jgi:hypothetical protein
MKLRDRVDQDRQGSLRRRRRGLDPEAEAKAKMLENDPKYADFATMMVKPTSA